MTKYPSLTSAIEQAQELALADKAEKFVYNMGQEYAISGKFRPKQSLAIVVFPNTLVILTGKEYRKYRQDKWIAEELTKIF